ncbi:MAG: DUF4123 domain-containing protein [Bryobacteraceae bacterium]
MPTTETAGWHQETPFTAGIRNALRTVWTVREEHLLVMLDAAHIPNLHHLLRELNIQNLPLFRESPEENILHVTPFICRFSPSEIFLHWMTMFPVVLETALFCTSTAPLEQTHAHLRRFLLVKDDIGRQVYFRFWDPRVIAPFLESATPEERRWFCGPIRSVAYYDKAKYQAEFKVQLLNWRMPPELAATPLKPLPDVHRPFQFRPEQMRRFEQQMSESYDQRLVAYLKERYPKQLAEAKPEQLKKLVLDARGAGPKIGLNSGREITHFAELMVIGLDDARIRAIRSLAPKGRTEALAAMVEDARKEQK